MQDDKTTSSSSVPTLDGGLTLRKPKHQKLVITSTKHCSFQVKMVLYPSKAMLLPLLISLMLSCYATSIFALASSVGSQRTVLVTGGAGYIGSHTCLELLNSPGDQYNVVVVDSLDNSSEESLKRVRDLTGCAPGRLQFRNCDIRDKEGLKKGEPMIAVNHVMILIDSR
jgi:hypothetical protein